MNWQPMDTAPTDGTQFLAVQNLEEVFYQIVVVMHYEEDIGFVVSWDHDTSLMPTYWMPLPNLPDPF